MFTVELYAKIRHAVMIDGLSRREAAKRFGVHRFGRPGKGNDKGKVEGLVGFVRRSAHFFNQSRGFAYKPSMRVRHSALSKRPPPFLAPKRSISS
jgi:transposase